MIVKCMLITIRYPNNINAMVSLGNVVLLIGIYVSVKKKKTGKLKVLYFHEFATDSNETLHIY